MLNKNNTGLVLIDVQGSLARLVQNSDLIIANIKKLIECCKILSLPVIWLEQNPKGLGETITEISDLLQESTVHLKSHFNGLYEESIREAIKAADRQQWLVAGIEAHVCVYQSVMGLLKEGYKVEVVVDCISSRLQYNVDLALSKMNKLGVNLTSLEMCVFELVKDSKDKSFREILSVIK